MTCMCLGEDWGQASMSSSSSLSSPLMQAVCLPDDDVDLRFWFVADQHKTLHPSGGLTFERPPLSYPPGPMPMATAMAGAVPASARLVGHIRQLQPAQNFNVRAALMRHVVPPSEGPSERDRQAEVVAALGESCGFLLYAPREPCARCRQAGRPCLMLTIDTGEHRCLGCQLEALAEEGARTATVANTTTRCCDGSISRHMGEVAAMIALNGRWRWRRWHDLRLNRPTHALNELERQLAERYDWD